MEPTINYFDYATSQEGWEKINEGILLREKELMSQGAGKNGNCIYSYNNVIRIRKAWVDPEFNFARIFGYRLQKWTSLVNNYVDMNYLDLVKNDIHLREKKKAQNYNISFHFSNAHDNGKDCLIALTFSRRYDCDIPVISFVLRASEVTKRLLWDLLLVQRMAEYVYGENQPVSLYLYCPMMFLNAEAFTMYETHKSIKKILKPQIENLQPFQASVLTLLKKFQTVDPESINYKVHRRSVRQLQTDENGTPLSGHALLRAKDLSLTGGMVIYPDSVITERQRKEHRKNMSRKNISR